MGLFRSSLNTGVAAFQGSGLEGVHYMCVGVSTHLQGFDDVLEDAHPHSFLSDALKLRLPAETGPHLHTQCGTIIRTLQ